MCENITKKVKSEKNQQSFSKMTALYKKPHIPYAYELMPIFTSKTQSTVSTPPPTLEFFELKNL
jgi:hypothetical protein